MFEYIYIAGSSMPISVDAVTLINWSHEGYELARDDPIEVTILNFLVVLIFFSIECLEIIPSKTKCFLESLKTMKHCAFVKAVTLASISETFETWLVEFELSISNFCVHFEDYNHEGTHEKASICDLGGVSAGTVVVDSRLS